QGVEEGQFLLCVAAPCCVLVHGLFVFRPCALCTSLIHGSGSNRVAGCMEGDRCLFRWTAGRAISRKDESIRTFAGWLRRYVGCCIAAETGENSLALGVVAKTGVSGFLALVLWCLESDMELSGRVSRIGCLTITGHMIADPL